MQPTLMFQLYEKLLLEMSELSSMTSEDTASLDAIQQRWPLFFSGAEKYWNIFKKLSFSAEAYNASMDQLTIYDLRPLLRKIRIPTLCLVGENDAASLERTQELAAGIENSELRVLPNCGHFPFLEKPREFAGIVSDFLVRISA